MSWERVIGWGAETGLMITVLIVFVLLIRRPVAKTFGAKAAYALWALPIMRLFTPGITLPNFLPAKPDVLTVNEISYAYTSSDVLVAPVAADWTTYMLPVLAVIWVMGAAIYLLNQVLKQSELADRLNYESEAAPMSIKSLAKDAAKQLGFKKVPAIRMGLEGTGPLVCRITKPTIYLPYDFEQQFTLSQQRFALLHEMAHIKRRDLWAAWAWLIFRAVNWPNPLVHYANHAFRADQEAACDATVIALVGPQKSSIVAYAETLLRAAQNAAQTGRASPARGELALTIHQPLKERLNMLNTNTSKSGWLARVGASAIVIAAFGLTAPLSLAENHPHDDAPVKTEKNVSKSVMKFITNEDGKEMKRHIEIITEDGEVKAYEIDEDGDKVEIDPDDIDIEGFDIETMKGGRAFAFSSGGDGEGKVMKRVMKMMSKKDFDKWRDGDFKEWKDGEFAEWVEKQSDGKENVFVFKGEGGEMMFPHPPKAPNAPHVLRFEKHGSHAPGDMHMKMRIRSAESMLEAAETMIEEAEKTGEDARKLAKAKRSLEKARKSLRDAEKALLDD